MKRLLAILLVVLMAMPFALLASAADAPPAEPVVDKTVPTYYLAFAGAANGDDSGKDAANPLPSEGWAEGGTIYEASKNGAIFIIEQKGYAGAALATIKPSKPVVFTSLDPADNVSNIAKKEDGSYDVDSQIGMFLKDTASDATQTDKNTIAFQGPVIFENTVIMNRKANAGIFKVQDGGSLVIKDTCDIIFGVSGTEAPSLVVEEGGYAYLHNVGFSSYTGNGTIVLDRALVTAGKVTKDIFEGFEGKIVAQDGSDPFTAPDLGPIPTGDMTWVVAAVASIAVMGTAVVVAKKKA